jgi:hypothetical protein
MKEKGTFTTSEGTGGYNNKPLNQFKITMKSAVGWLQGQYNQCPKYEERIHDEDWDKALEMEKEQNEKYNELKEVVQTIVSVVDDRGTCVLTRDSLSFLALQAGLK